MNPLTGVPGTELPRPDLVDRCVEISATSPLVDGTVYGADTVGAGLRYELSRQLRSEDFLCTDLLLEGTDLAVFEFTLHTPDGLTFRLRFGALAQCQARVRIPLTVTDMNVWMMPREAAWLKPQCAGDPVDPSHVDRLELRVFRTNGEPVRWSMTPLRVVDAEPPRLHDPVLPRGPLLDEFGQSTLHEWPTRTRDERELITRLTTQRASADLADWPVGFSRWGGWQSPGPVLDGTGFFRTHHDGRRWWLIDPDGYRFWSAGVDNITPVIETAVDGLSPALTAPTVPPAEPGNYLVSNLVRAFGADHWREDWAAVTTAQLKEYGFNTIGNWSDLDTARRSGVGYVRPLRLQCRRTPMIYRDFPDVFAPEFAQDAEDFAEALRDTVDDPALIGYFLMNEPTWGFADETPAAGMLRTSGPCASRGAFRDFLSGRYPDHAAVVAAWGDGQTVDGIASTRWVGVFPDSATKDLEDFSTLLVAELFGRLSTAAAAVDPNHLNLGARYYTIPPGWALAGMTDFDVFSINCYQERVPADAVQQLSEQTQRPILIGEWHFGALDAGLPASGIGHVPDQTSRGQAYRNYVENAAALPWCVGTHYFTWYDQSAMGRFDGENYAIGLLDICNRPYEPVVGAALQAHSRMYDVAAGEAEPYADAPVYLPKLFI